MPSKPRALHLSDINTHVARALVDILLPPCGPVLPYWSGNRLIDLVTTVTPDSSLRFASLASNLIASRSGWIDAARRLGSLCPKFHPQHPETCTPAQPNPTKLASPFSNSTVEVYGPTLLIARGPVERPAQTHRPSQCPVEDTVTRAVLKSSGLHFLDSSSDSIAVRYTSRVASCMAPSTILPSSCAPGRLSNGVNALTLDTACTLSLASNRCFP